MEKEEIITCRESFVQVGENLEKNASLADRLRPSVHVGREECQTGSRPPCENPDGWHGRYYEDIRLLKRKAQPQNLHGSKSDSRPTQDKCIIEPT